MSDEIQLAFEGSVSVYQRLIIIDTNYDEKSIIEGLKSGDLCTTMGHDDASESCLYKLPEMSVVAKVVSQEVQGEYEDYR